MLQDEICKLDDDDDAVAHLHPRMTGALSRMGDQKADIGKQLQLIDSLYAACRVREIRLSDAKAKLSTTFEIRARLKGCAFEFKPRPIHVVCRQTQSH